MGQVTAKRPKAPEITYALAPEERVKRRGAILEVLARAAEDSEFLARLAENPEEALAGYYTLAQEEVAALISGDIKKIESWLGKLDKKHATWLWCRLQQEKW
jgi:predicted ATPase